VHNPDVTPVEIEVELIYGYPRGDGEGGVRVFLDPDPDQDEPSCANWVRALPRRVILMPGDRQTIRFLARPPAGLADGEYWSRIVITSRPADHHVQGIEVEEAEGVQVGLTLATRTIVSLTYRKGPLTTGIEVDNLEAQLTPREIITRMNLTRLGSAAWLGRVDAVLLDVDGEEITRWDRALAVYEDHRRVLRFPLDRRIDPGSYILSLRYSTERTDLPPEGVIPSEPVARAFPLVVMSALSK
jgi:hypothetical protein